MNKTTKQILTDARDAILANPNNLGNGTLVKTNPDADEGYCYCALGHIAKAAGYEVDTDAVSFKGIRGNYAELMKMEAVDILSKVIIDDTQLNYPDNVSNVYLFNDEAVRKAQPDKVVDAFNKAIELADEHE